MVNVYVLNKDGSPLMPIHSYGRAKRLLKSGKARIASTRPFTVQLKEQIDNPVLEECLLGIDPGRTNIGLCVIDRRGRVLFASDLKTRNKAIAKLMLDRKRARQASRRGERKVRQRRAVSSDKKGMARAVEFWRMLPGCSKPVCCKIIRNQPAKFEHRKRKNGWLTPTANHLLQTHVNVVKKIMKLLPVSCIAIEINRFDFAKMENPGIKNWEYQMGKLAGYKDVDEAVFIQQKGKCLLCGKPIQHYHHIVPVSKGGSENIDNKAGLCSQCHAGPKGVHKSSAARKRLERKKKGLLKKYHALSVINQVMERLLLELTKIRPVYITAGYETQKIRRTCLPYYPKAQDDGTHYIDAWCIAVAACGLNDPEHPDFCESFYEIVQFRRHDRAIINAQKERTYYLDGKVVAHNRHKRTGQADTKENWDSLAEFRAKNPKAVSKLTVKKSTRSYNEPGRVLPGATIRYNGNNYILKGNHNDRFILFSIGGSGIPKSKCEIARHNTGLVFI